MSLGWFGKFAMSGVFSNFSGAKLVCLVLVWSSFGCEALKFHTLDQDVGPVIFTNILFRHGERTIIKPYANDPNKDPSYWPLGWGQLTKAGIHHHYVLGNWLGERYAHLLPHKRTYNRTAIYIRSTDVDRTLMSAESNMAGMFPMTQDEDWKGLNWQPTPIHTVPENLDNLLAMNYPCKRYDYESQKFMESTEYLNLLKKYKFLGDYCAKLSGDAFTSFNNFEYLYSTLLIEDLNNYTIPAWARTVFPNKLRTPAGISFAIPTWTAEMKRLRGGPLVKEMLNNMKTKISAKLPAASLNISVYSAHDTTVANFLNTIDLYNMLPPPFASLVLVELRKTAKNENVVTVLFKNTTDPAGVPYILTIPGCAEACPIEQVERIWKPVIPDDWDTECHKHELFDLTSDLPYNTLAVFGNETDDAPQH